MRCRFCGDNLHSTNQKLFSPLGEKCLGNPSGHHVGLSDGVCCVFCGDNAKAQNGKLITKIGIPCRFSPTGMHCLQ